MRLKLSMEAECNRALNHLTEIRQRMDDEKYRIEALQIDYAVEGLKNMLEDMTTHIDTHKQE